MRQEDEYLKPSRPFRELSDRHKTFGRYPY